MAGARAALAGPSRSVAMTDLAAALKGSGIAVPESELSWLPDTGLAHDHARIGTTGLLARIPKQSQMQLGADENLAYQAACFARASASGHAPRLHHVLARTESLPRGGLVVDCIEGRPPRLPADLPAIATALGRIHRLPMLPACRRGPLKNAADPISDLIAEVEAQGAHLQAAGLEPEAAELIAAALDELRRTAERTDRPPKTFISFDAHPGNFIIRADGSAVLVDLEKARYAYPPLDLAHASLFTSTTWDVATYAELSLPEIAGFYRAWEAAAGPELANGCRRWHADLRRGMWLWSVTWCAKWRALSGAEAKRKADGEDWSAAKSEARLIEHVRGRVDCYLSAEIVARVSDEIAALDGALGR